MTASEPTPPIASPSPAAPLASQLAANPCSHPSFDQFVATIAALRAPDGCPWDRTQTHQSIAHNMIEEAYEAVDAIEAADVVLMDDDPAKIAKAIRISRKCLRIVYENIVFAIGIKLACLVLVALGFANMWLAIFADVGVMILAVLNAIRALFVKKL